VSRHDASVSIRCTALTALPLSGRTCTSSLSAAECLRMSSRSHPRHWAGQTDAVQAERGRQASRQRGGQRAGSTQAGGQRGGNMSKQSGGRACRHAGVHAGTQQQHPVSLLLHFALCCCWLFDSHRGKTAELCERPAPLRLFDEHAYDHACTACVPCDCKLPHILKPAWSTHPLCVVVEIQGLPG
jgi:hypothetical protein